MNINHTSSKKKETGIIHRHTNHHDETLVTINRSEKKNEKRKNQSNKTITENKAYHGILCTIIIIKLLYRDHRMNSIIY